MNRVKELLKTEYPLIQGGMANIATGAFAAAISEAGAMGMIGSGGMTPEVLRREIRFAKERTNKPFGVNIMLMNPYVDQLAEIVIEEGIFAVTTGAGNPAKYMERWKENGILVIPVVASTGLARRMESIGADMVIAEGCEAGGHIGELTTMSLVPQVVDAVHLPVIAAGGIATDRQVVAAMALGAEGVQVGTCLLVSEECPVHENYKNALIKAKDIDTAVTGRSLGSPVRCLKNWMTNQYLKFEREGASQEEMERLTLGSLRKAVLEGDVKNGSVMAGQVAGLLKEVRPARKIISDLFEGTKKVKDQLIKEAM